MTVDKVTFVTTRQHLRRQEEPYFRLTPPQLNELLSEYEQARNKPKQQRQTDVGRRCRRVGEGAEESCDLLFCARRKKPTRVQHKGQIRRPGRGVTTRSAG